MIGIESIIRNSLGKKIKDKITYNHSRIAEISTSAVHGRIQINKLAMKLLNLSGGGLVLIYDIDTDDIQNRFFITTGFLLNGVEYGHKVSKTGSFLDVSSYNALWAFDKPEARDWENNAFVAKGYGIKHRAGYGELDILASKRTFMKVEPYFEVENGNIIRKFSPAPELQPQIFFRLYDFRYVDVVRKVQVEGN